MKKAFYVYNDGLKLGCFKTKQDAIDYVNDLPCFVRSDIEIREGGKSNGKKYESK